MPDGPVITDWMAVATGIIALIAAVYFARRQTSILERQADIQKTQSGLLSSQTNLMKLSADIARNQTAIQERQADIARQQLAIIEDQEKERLNEKRKANLVAWIEKKIDMRLAQHFLMIKNNGPADARNIALFLNGTPISKHRSVSSSLGDIVNQLSSGSKIEYRMVLTGDSSGVFNLDMVWDDDSNESRRAQTVLNAF